MVYIKRQVSDGTRSITDRKSLILRDILSSTVTTKLVNRSGIYTNYYYYYYYYYVFFSSTGPLFLNYTSSCWVSQNEPLRFAQTA